MAQGNVIVVGGGVIGGAIAFELASRGNEVSLVDKGPFFGEASTASAGMLCPQAEQFDATTQTEVFAESLKLHRPWTESLEEISGIPVQYAKRGMLRLVYSEKLRQAAHDVLPKKPFAVWLSAAQVLSMEPDVKAEGLEGAVYFPDDGQLHPKALAKALHSALIRSGCKLHTNCPVLSLITNGNNVIGVRTSQGDMYADTVIVAAGAWSSSLLSPLGLSIPVVPVKGQMLALSAPDVRIRHVVQGPGGMVLPRMDGTLTVGVTHEHSGYDKVPTVPAITQVFNGVSSFVPKLHGAAFCTTWAGLRPGTPDGLPYIGQPSGRDGLWVATGHYTVGIFLAPITAKLLAAMIHGEEPCVDASVFSPDRACKA